MRARKAHVRPGGLEGHGGLRTPRFGKLGNLAAQPPSYMSYTSYMSYRVVLWHVADVPGVQGELLPAGAWGSAPHLSNQPIILFPF